MYENSTRARGRKRRNKQNRKSNKTTATPPQPTHLYGTRANKKK
jgi:hypothetical protein